MIVPDPYYTERNLPGYGYARLDPVRSPGSGYASTLSMSDQEMQAASKRKREPVGFAPRPKACWYFTNTVSCPQCGRSTTYRERRYTPKPASADARYGYREAWDGCGV